MQELFPDFRERKSLKFLKLFENAPNNVYPNPYRFLQNKKSNQELDQFADVEKKQKAKKSGMTALRMPRPDEMAEDDAQTSLQEMAWCVEAEIAEEDAKEDKPKKIPQWRNGPAKLWYDILDVPQDTVKSIVEGYYETNHSPNYNDFTFANRG